MITQISSTVQRARKIYYDDGWDEIQEWISAGCPVYVDDTYKRGHLLFSEARYLVNVRNQLINPSKIQIGQTYRRQFNKMDGDAYTWRTKEEFYKLMCKYELFPEL